MSSDAITPNPNPNPKPNAEAAPAPEPPPRFDTEPYRLTNAHPPLGTLLLLTALPAAGVLIGLLTSIVAQRLYLVVLFPALMGLAAGGVGWVLVKVGKARGPALIATAAGITAIAMMAGFHFGVFLHVVNEEIKNQPDIQMADLVDLKTFANFIDARAEDGVTIGKPGREDKGINLGYAGSYVYWLAEIGFAGYVIFVTLRTAASTPLCERCRRWKREWQLKLLPATAPEVVREPLHEGDLLTLLTRWPATGAEGLALKAAACPTCGPEGTVDVALEVVRVNHKGGQVAERVDCVRYPGTVLPFLDSWRGPA
jgi:hypothetical protein